MTYNRTDWPKSADDLSYVEKYAYRWDEDRQVFEPVYSPNLPWDARRHATLWLVIVEPSMDGVHTVTEVVAPAARECSPEEIRAALELQPQTAGNPARTRR